MEKINSNEARFHLGKVICSDWLVIILVAANLITAFIIYPYMPEQVPSHWNFQGEVDDYTSRFLGTFGPPLLIAGLYLSMVFIPLIDPRRHNYMKFTGAFQIFKLVLIIFLTGLYVLTILYSLGYQISMNRFVSLGVSVLFIVLGNYMGQIRHNYFVGIKTPWTLDSEEVWRKTHSFGAKVWVVGGIVGVVGALINSNWGLFIMIAALAVVVVLPVIYSFLTYKQIKN